MTTRAEVVRLARGWLGVPFRDEGRGRGGVDCVGLVVRVGQEAGLVPEGFETGGYPREPDGTLLRRIREAGMRTIPASRVAGGSVIVFGWGPLPQARHLGIVTDAAAGHFVHACNARGRVVAGVVGDDRRSSARVVAAFDFPGIEG